MHSGLPLGPTDSCGMLLRMEDQPSGPLENQSSMQVAFRTQSQQSAACLYQVKSIKPASMRGACASALLFTCCREKHHIYAPSDRTNLRHRFLAWKLYLHAALRLLLWTLRSTQACIAPGSHAGLHLCFRGSAAFTISSTCRTWRPCSVRLCHACMLRKRSTTGQQGWSRQLPGALPMHAAAILFQAVV